MARELVQNLQFKKGGPLDANAIAAFFEEQYLKQNRPTEFKQKKTFSPSSIGGYNGLCPRYWYIAFTGAEFVESNDAIGIANMANGTAAHARLQGLLEKSGINVELEVEVKLENPPVRGFIDVIMEWEGEPIVGEIKTTREEVFMYRQSTMKPSPQHLIQILLYLKATKRKKGFLLYENKNTNAVLVIPVEYSERNKEILNNTLGWMQKVYDNYTDGVLPERPYRKNNKICQGCPVLKECGNLPAGDIKIEPMEVPKV